MSCSTSRVAKTTRTHLRIPERRRSDQQTEKGKQYKTRSKSQIRRKVQPHTNDPGPIVYILFHGQCRKRPIKRGSFRK